MFYQLLIHLIVFCNKNFYFLERNLFFLFGKGFGIHLSDIRQLIIQFNNKF